MQYENVKSHSIMMVLSGSLFFTNNAMAVHLPTPTTSFLDDYLVVATGSGTSSEMFEAFNSNGGELGADQEVVSSGTGSGENPETQEHRSYTDIGLDLTGTFVPEDGKNPFNSNNRWTDADPDYVDGDNILISDFLPGARRLGEEPDYSGNVALTGEYAGFSSENTDYFASFGINCRIDPDDCYISDDKDNSWFVDDASNGVDLGTGSGVNQFDPTGILSELDDWQTFIDHLDKEFTIDHNIEDESYKDGGTPFVTDLDAIDTNNDGFAVIEIDVSGDFKVNNSDWILDSENNEVTAIFKIKAGNNSNYLFSNSSIMLGDGCEDANGDPLQTNICDEDPISELGAIFYSEGAAGNQVFNLSNVILGGVALWDLDADRDTIITANNIQGCTQLISSKVELSSKNRLQRCALSASVVPPTPVSIPEPEALFTFLLGCFITFCIKRKV